MAAERIAEVDRFHNILDEVALWDIFFEEIVEELRVDMAGGNFKIVVSEVVPVWRVADRGQRKAVLFVPKGITEEQIRAQLPDIIGESLAILRGLPGPRLGEVDFLKEVLRGAVSASE